MFLIILEDGEVRKTSEVTSQDKKICDWGYIEIIDITDPEAPTTYYQDKWHKVGTLTDEERGVAAEPRYQ